MNTEDDPGHIDYVLLARQFIKGKCKYLNYVYGSGSLLERYIVGQIIREAKKSNLSEDDFNSRLEEFDDFISDILCARMPLFEQRAQRDRQAGREIKIDDDEELLQLPLALRGDETALQENGAQLVDQSGPFTDQSVS